MTATERSKDFADSAAAIALLLWPQQKEDLLAGKTIRVVVTDTATAILSRRDPLGQGGRGVHRGKKLISPAPTRHTEIRTYAMTTRTKTALTLLAALVAAGCATTLHDGAPGCRQQCEPYKPENEGGWSGLWRQIDTDGTDYKQCLNLCHGRTQ